MATHHDPMSDPGRMGIKDASVVPWYEPDPSVIPEDILDFVQRYTKMPRDELMDRLMEARDRLWEVFPWPCVGLFGFLETNIYLHPRPGIQSWILTALQNGARFLDIGCCFAQDIRRLVADGAPTDNIYAIDIQAGFIEAAFDFFGDRDNPPAHFMVGDMTRPETLGELDALEGTFDIINLGQVMHVWSWEEQLQILERVVRLLAPTRWSLVVGTLVSRTEGMEWSTANNKPAFYHNAETFERMWDEVGRRTGTSWKLQSSIHPNQCLLRPVLWGHPNAKRMYFTLEKRFEKPIRSKL